VIDFRYVKVFIGKVRKMPVYFMRSLRTLRYLGVELRECRESELIIWSDIGVLINVMQRG
jgi:hypothetical protein